MFAGVLCSWSDNDRKNMCYNNIFLKQSGKGVEENSRFYMVYCFMYWRIFNFLSRSREAARCENGRQPAVTSEKS